jgi:para-nitrobenzyl esterase
MRAGLNFFGIAFVSLLAHNCPLAAAETETLEIAAPAGAVRGFVADDVAVFRGIPYAQPPVGELRWRPPQQLVAWEGGRDASEYGHACPQPLGKYPAWADAALESAGLSEDCLTLNIYSPVSALVPAGESTAGSAAATLPVMFYIHGGNMQFGANSLPLYDSSVLARAGVVVVVINYRVGYLGRFGHPAMTRVQAGEPLVNYGLFDQIAALEWVQRNIRSFGGDPNDVTIFGHSSGGVSVNTLMVTPQSKGLFHKAIAQGSGILLDRNQHAFKRVPRAGLTGLSSEDFGRELADNFALTADSDAAMLAQLRALTWQQIIEYQQSSQKPFNPVVDGIVLTDDTARVFERGEQHDVPYIGGANSWEWNQIADIPLIGKWFLGGALIEGLSDEDIAVFDDQWTRIGLSQRWFAEGLFLTSTRYFAKQMANVRSPAWLYHVTYVQTAIRGTVPGAGHGIEMPYVFGQIAEHPEYQRPEAAADFPPSAEDLRWGDTVRGYWRNFAKTGNPNGAGLPEWPQYTPDNDLTLVMGEAFVPTAGLNKQVLDYLEARALQRRTQYDALDDQ